MSSALLLILISTLCYLLKKHHQNKIHSINSGRKSKSRHSINVLENT
jgi:hypothetical protein